MNRTLDETRSVNHLSTRQLFVVVVSGLLLPLVAGKQGYTDDVKPSGSAVEINILPPSIVDFRVISTRNCPQEGNSLYSPEQFDYFRLDGSRQWQNEEMDHFVSSLSSENPLSFFVHGNLVTWETAFAEGWQAANAMRSAIPRGRKLTVVMFTWASDRQTPLPGIDVEIKAARADTTGFYLAQLIRKLPQNVRVSLVGHSHGARAAAGALQLLNGGVVAGRVLPVSHSTDALPALRAVFLAGTLDHNSLALGKKYDRVLNSAEAVLNIRNSRDSILALYPLRMPFAESAIGKVGLKKRDWQRLGKHQRRVQQIDVANMIGSSHDWGSYFHQPGINAAIAQFVAFEE